MDPKSVVSKQKCIDYIERWPFIVIFQYVIDIFVWVQHSCLANMVFTLGSQQPCYKEVMVSYTKFGRSLLESSH